MGHFGDIYFIMSFEESLETVTAPSTSGLFGNDSSDSDSDTSTSPTLENGLQNPSQNTTLPPSADVAPVTAAATAAVTAVTAELNIVKTPLINDDDEMLVYTKVSSFTC